jgi:hypothetical protein
VISITKVISTSLLIITGGDPLISTEVTGMEPLRIFVQTLGLNPSGDRHGSGWADFDNDGDLDLSIRREPGVVIVTARRRTSFGKIKELKRRFALSFPWAMLSRIDG